MVHFVPAPDPAARALKMGLAGESSFFLISRFKGMRGMGKRGEAPATCSGERARAPFVCAGKRSKPSAARGCAGADRAGLSVISLAGTVPSGSHTCATCSSGGEFDKFFGCPWQWTGMEQGGAGMDRLGAADLGVTPQSYRFNLPTRGFAVFLGNAVFGAEKGTRVTCVLAGSSQLGLGERARPLLPPCPQPVPAPPCRAVSGLVVSSPPGGIRECRSLAPARMSEMMRWIGTSAGDITEGIGP